MEVKTYCINCEKELKTDWPLCAKVYCYNCKMYVRVVYTGITSTATYRVESAVLEG